MVVTRDSPAQEERMTMGLGGREELTVVTAQTVASTCGWDGAVFQAREEGAGGVARGWVERAATTYIRRSAGGGPSSEEDGDLAQVAG
jgi:hypothetical protein